MMACVSVVLLSVACFRKVPKFSDARNFAVIHIKFKQRGQTLGYYVENI